MNSTDIKFLKSIAFYDNKNDGEHNCNIKIGVKDDIRHYTYIYFDTSLIKNCKKIRTVKLIFFKAPNIENQSICEFKIGCQCRIVPTIQYISAYNYNYSNNIDVDNRFEVNFFVRKNLAYVEVDISKIFIAWTNNVIENKGLIINCEDSSQYLEFLGIGENIFDYPFVRVNYDENKLESNSIVKLPFELEISK